MAYFRGRRRQEEERRRRQQQQEQQRRDWESASDDSEGTKAQRAAKVAAYDALQVHSCASGPRFLLEGN